MSKKNGIYMLHRMCDGNLMAGWQSGYAEDCKSFYIGSIPVPASTVRILFRLSSAVEQSAVNRSVVGSNPTAGAKVKHPKGCFFCIRNEGINYLRFFYQFILYRNNIVSG